MLPTEPLLPYARELIEMERYFVVHGPRQSGKTTALRALARTLNAEGRVAAVWLSCENGKVAGDDVGWGESLVSAVRSAGRAVCAAGSPGSRSAGPARSGRPAAGSP
ncbi:hypothetical protein [Actinocorallia herbida]|nr:hypothetical protein [Actinocorallia herbida]